MGFLGLIDWLFERVVRVLLKPTFDKAKFDAAIAHLHAVGEFTPEMLHDIPIKKLIEETNKILSQAVSRAIADNIISHDMKRRLSQDVFVFSGFKTYRALKDAAALLRDNEGIIKSFGQFRREAAKLNEAYNKNRLQAEYLFAITSAQQAAHWTKIKKDGDHYDLRYRTASDDCVKNSHAALEDIVLPATAPFWDNYFPPNGWHCRCFVTQVLKGKYAYANSAQAITLGDQATTQIDKDGKNPLAIFRFNPGKQKAIFPPHHPYKPKGEEGKKVEGILRTASSRDWEIIKKFKNGGTVQVHSWIDKNTSDYHGTVECATFFAGKGEEVKVLPKVHFKNEYYKELFGGLINTKYKRKCPDFKVGDNLYEYESFTDEADKNKVKKMISRGLKQSSRIVIEESEATDYYLEKLIHDHIRNGNHVEEVWVKNKKNMRLVFKKQ